MSLSFNHIDIPQNTIIVQHIATSIVQDTESVSDKFTCSECGKIYKTNIRYQSHILKRHSNGKPATSTINKLSEKEINMSESINTIPNNIPLNTLPSISNISTAIKYNPVLYDKQIIKTEHVNKAALEYIVTYWDGLQFRPSVEEDNEWDPYKICKEYLERLNKKGEKKTFYSQKNNRGRFFAVKGLSLQSMPREIRHTIASEYYWDLDFENCHPQLLYQYCKKQNIDCTQLELYVNNRSGLIDKLIKINPNKDKDAIKKVILAIMNGGELDYKELGAKTNWLKLFYCEIKEILTTICKLNKSAFEQRRQSNIKNKKDYNHEGSYVNTILCELENDAIQCLDKFLTSKGYQVDVLVFDGLMVAKQNDLLIDTTILEEATIFIQRRIGYKLKIIEKTMNEGFNIPKSFLQTEYDKWKINFELTDFKIINLTSYLHIDTIDKKPIFRKQADLLDAYTNCEFIKDWVKDENIKAYRKIDFLPAPLECPADVYNLFSGFEVQNLDKITYSEISIQPILKHISYLVNHTPENFNYMLNWLANIFQTPGKTTNTAIIIKSEQGIGKNILFDFLKSIIGEEYCIGTADPERDCFGDFNNLLMNKILINLNETKASDTIKYIELIKSYITEKKLQIKLKGKDSVSINNFMRWIFFTNRRLPFKF